MVTKQSLIGLSSNLITGSAALFYNKVGAVDQVSAGTTWTSTKHFYAWQTLAPNNSWGDKAVDGTTLATATSAFTFSDGSGVTEYWEVPAFLPGAAPDTGESYAYTLEQAAVDDTAPDSKLQTYLATLPEYGTLGKTHPYGTIGYTTNGMSITFTPEWGEIQVDQLLDAARIFKTGQTATINTTIAEATLENLAIALAQPRSFYPKTNAGGTYMELNAGNLYDCPVERSLVAIGPGQGGCDAGSAVERVYTAYRALSQEAVTVSMSRNDPQTYDVAFRLMPNSAGSYGRVVDRLTTADTQNSPAYPYA